MLSMHRLIFIFGLILLLKLPLFGQQDSSSIYRFNKAVDFTLSSSSLSMGLIYQLSDQMTRPMSIAAIQKLDRGHIPDFDRFAVENWSPNAALISDVFLYGAVMLPFGLLLHKKVRKDWSKFALIYAECFLMNASMTALCKNIIKRPRPFMYNPDLSLDLKRTNNGQYSFFSGHTSTVACMSFMTAKIFQDYHPQPGIKPLVWTLAAILPAITGYLRVDAGKHFLSDVLVGYAFGAFVGILIPSLHKVKKKRSDLKVQF